MSQLSVFADLFWRHLCLWCSQFLMSGTSQSSTVGDIERKEIGPVVKVNRFSGGTSRIVFIARGVILALLMIGLLGTPSSVWAQISLVHATTCGPATFPGTTCTIPATGSGNLIVVGWQVGGGGSLSATISSISDNTGNTYLEAGAARSVDEASGFWIDIWFAKNCKAGTTSVFVNPNSSVTNSGAVIWEFLGVDTTAPLDQTSTLSNQLSTTTPVGAPVTITAANQVVVSIITVAQNVTGIASGNPFIDDSAQFYNGWAHYNSSSTGTYSAKWNQNPSGTYASSTVSFKAAGTYSTCDLNQDAAVDILDVQVGTNLALALSNCTAPYGQCNIPMVQAVLTNAMGGACLLPVLGNVPTGISFGNVAVGSSNTQTLTLTGTGNSSTTLSQVTVSGTGFSISGLSLPLTLSVGQSASFSVTLTPTSAGSASGNLVFSSNALNAPATQPLKVPLSGAGVTIVAHTVTLTWTPSTSSNVASYNIYGSALLTSPASAPSPLSVPPYVSVGSVSATTCSPTLCTYIDSNSGIQSGQTRWYYVTAVDTGNNVSAPSNTGSAVLQ